MGGNRKSGFMYGNRAGRNGVGQPKAFYCVICEKEHGISVEPVGMTRYFGTETKVCNSKYLKFKDDEYKALPKIDAINTLKKLKSPIGLEGIKGLKNRIKFLITTFNSELHSKLCHYELYDAHNIGERDFDTCFEMKDGDKVVHGVIKASKKNLWLRHMLIQQLTKEGYERWLNTYNEVESHTTEEQLELAV
ncbi:MAG: hypothetical protein HAW67_05330 [Endozoicomonadaceae bacterium]|nr:hypothetical protein [Endozoicomonadaceae bacterium]